MLQMIFTKGKGFKLFATPHSRVDLHYNSKSYLNKRKVNKS